MPIIVSIFLGILPLIFSFSTQQIFEVNKFTILLFASALIALWLIWEKTYYYNTKAIIGIGIFYITIFCSALFSTTPLVSMIGSAERHMGLMTLLCGGIIFMGCIHAIKKYSLATILIPISMSGLIIAVYAILQKIGIDPLFGMLDVKSMSMRSFGFLGQPNFLAQTMIIPFFYSILLIKQSTIDTLGKNILYTIVLIIFSIACWTTDSRAGMLAMLVGLSIMGIASTSWKCKKIYTTLVLLIPVGIWSMVYIGGDFLGFSERGSSFLARHYFWNDALALWSSSIKNIFLGVGPDVLSSSWQHVLSYQAFASEYFLMMPDRVHSLWIDILVQWGIVAWAIVLLATIMTLQKAWNNNTILFAALCAIGTSWSFGFFVITDCIFFISLLAIIWANDWKGGIPSIIQKIIIPVLGITIAIAAVIIGTCTWVSDKAFYEKKYSLVLIAPWLETNLIRAWDTADPNTKHTIEQIGNTYHFSSRGFLRIQFLSAYRQKDTTLMQYFFRKWWESAGNNPLEKIRILIEVHTLSVVNQAQYEALAKETLKSFPSKNDTSFFAQKLWKSLDNQIIWKSVGDEIELLQKTFQ